MKSCGPIEYAYRHDISLSIEAILLPAALLLGQSGNNSVPQSIQAMRMLWIDVLA
jgi:hypothetical protein